MTFSIFVSYILCTHIRNAHHSQHTNGFITWRRWNCGWSWWTWWTCGWSHWTQHSSQTCGCHLQTFPCNEHRISMKIKASLIAVTKAVQLLRIHGTVHHWQNICRWRKMWFATTSCIVCNIYNLSCKCSFWLSHISSIVADSQIFRDLQISTVWSKLNKASIICNLCTHHSLPHFHWLRLVSTVVVVVISSWGSCRICSGRGTVVHQGWILQHGCNRVQVIRQVCFMWYDCWIIRNNKCKKKN